MVQELPQHSYYLILLTNPNITIVVNKKQWTVQHRGVSNINCSTVVLSLVFAAFHNQYLVLTMRKFMQIKFANYCFLLSILQCTVSVGRFLRVHECLFQYKNNVVNFKRIIRDIFIHLQYNAPCTCNVVSPPNLVNIMLLFSIIHVQAKTVKFENSVPLRNLQGWAHSFWQKQCRIKSLFFHFEEHCFYCSCSLLHKLIFAGYCSDVIFRKKKGHIAALVCFLCGVGPLSRQGSTHQKNRLFYLPLSQFYM